MFLEERHEHILRLLRERGKVVVEELVTGLGVSAPTIRADLAALEERKLLRRTHGGALALQPIATHDVTDQESASCRSDEKRRIGEAAAKHVRSGDTVIVDAGTTAHAVGLALVALGITGITVVTNNLPTAMVLMDTPGIEVVVIGGQTQERRRATLGPLAADFLAPIHADKLFLGINGIDGVAGLTAADFEAATIKRAMIDHATEVIVVADSSKLGHATFAQVASVSSVAGLITDNDAAAETVSALRDAGIGFIELV